MLFLTVLCYLIIFYISQVSAMIISPCKVRNLVTQPTIGTSLKSKHLVHIIQIHPVFLQNVMIGICENQNQNISTGSFGEFYVCQQRYSTVEVYIADSEASVKGDAHQTLKDKISSLKFIRETVIIESGCDFTFNLQPFFSNAANQPEQQQNKAHLQQQRMFLRSPYHPNVSGNLNPFRQQPAAHGAGFSHPGSGAAGPGMSPNQQGNYYNSHYYNSVPVAHSGNSKARASEADYEDENKFQEIDTEETDV